jgi:hypothetical protein
MAEYFLMLSAHGSFHPSPILPKTTTCVGNTAQLLPPNGCLQLLLHLIVLLLLIVTLPPRM